MGVPIIVVEPSPYIFGAWLRIVCTLGLLPMKVPWDTQISPQVPGLTSISYLIVALN